MSTLELENIKHPDNSGNNLTLTSGGNVGIGTSSPAVALEIIGTTTSGIRIKNNALHSNGFNIYVDSSTDTAVLNNPFSGPMLFETANTERMRVGSNGYVGVGTSTPLRKLHLADAGDTHIILQSTNAADNSEIFEIGAGANSANKVDLTFRTRLNSGSGGAERMRITNDGYVTTPNQPTFSIFGDTDPNYTSDVIYIGHTGSGAAAFDTNIGNHFSYTNGKFTAPVAGSYFFSFRATTGDTNSHFIDIHKNGVRVGGHTLSYGSSYITATNTAVLTLASGDYIEARRRATGYSLYSVNFSGFLIG